MLVIRLTRAGAKKRPFYRVIVTESRAPRDGAVLETLGTYNPTTKPETLKIDRERLAHWLKNGARPSDTVRTIVARNKAAEPTEAVTEQPAS